jgi:hypothetical protein
MYCSTSFLSRSLAYCVKGEPVEQFFTYWCPFLTVAVILLSVARCSLVKHLALSDVVRDRFKAHIFSIRIDPLPAYRSIAFKMKVVGL